MNANGPPSESARASSRLQAVNRVLARIETCTAGALLVTVCAVVLLQVLMRYLFAYPNPWSEEVSRYCFIWLSLLGASLAVEHRAHFRFDQVTGKLAPRTKRAVETGATVIVLGFSLLLIATGVALMDLTMEERSPALNLPVALVYAAAPVAGVLMVIHMLAGWEQEDAEVPLSAAPEQPGPTGTHASDEAHRAEEARPTEEPG